MIFKNRPRIKIKPTKVDKIIDIISLSVVVAIWAVVSFYYAKLPEIIPIHFNANGIADGYGSKNHILLLPIIATVFFVGLYLLNRVPHIHNYTIKITPENAPEEYTKSTKLIRYVNLILVMLLFWTLIKMISDVC